MTSLLTFSFYCINQIDFMLPCSICSVIDHRRHRNVVRTALTHLPNGLYCDSFFFLLHILMSFVIYYCTDTWQHGICLLNRPKFQSIIADND